MTSIPQNIWDIHEAFRKYALTSELALIDHFTIDELDKAAAFPPAVGAHAPSHQLLLRRIDFLHVKYQTEQQEKRWNDEMQQREKHFLQEIAKMEEKSKKESFHRIFQVYVTLGVGLFTICIGLFSASISNKNAKSAYKNTEIAQSNLNTTIDYFKRSTQSNLELSIERIRPNTFITSIKNTGIGPAKIVSISLTVGDSVFNCTHYPYILD
ncbi:MAG TPA: hypothetical protein DCO75_09940 [Fibrobacteres bacterium]|jgi:hypothetical protein|nr:hypothetical protein [Fibrobacterota bacterium]